MEHSSTSAALGYLLAKADNPILDNSEYTTVNRHGLPSDQARKSRDLPNVKIRV